MCVRALIKGLRKALPISEKPKLSWLEFQYIDIILKLAWLEFQYIDIILKLARLEFQYFNKQKSLKSILVFQYLDLRISIFYTLVYCIKLVNTGLNRDAFDGLFGDSVSVTILTVFNSVGAVIGKLQQCWLFEKMVDKLDLANMPKCDLQNCWKCRNLLQINAIHPISTL